MRRIELTTDEKCTVAALGVIAYFAVVIIVGNWNDPLGMGLGLGGLAAVVVSIVGGAAC